MMKPPHLPPETCDIRAHKAFKSVWWLLFLICVAGLASVALTLSTLVWFLPSFVPDQPLIGSQKSVSAELPEIDLTVLNNVKKRLWYIYDTREKVGGQFYPEQADRYQAVMFSSDGWAVAYIPNYRRGIEKYWEGVDYQGTVYNIQQVFVDSVSGLTYIKFEGNSFPFISFANWNDVRDGDSVWEVDYSDYEHHNIEKDLSVLSSEYKIWEPQLFYLVEDGESAGNILINDSGDMVGILNKDNRLIYGWLVNSQYASILRDGVPNYQAVSWSGYMVNGHASYGDLTKKISGFYVDKSTTKVTSSTIGVGDVITRIQNQQVNLMDLSRQVLLSPEDFTVTVYRDGQEFDIPVSKTKVIN